MAKFERIPETADAAHLRDYALAQYHPELQAYGVKVGLEFASVDPEAAAKGVVALRAPGGGRALALVRVVPEKQRRYGMPDAIIQIDKDEWDDWEDRTRLAVLDHELQHLVLAKDKDGTVKIDRCLRPVLKTRQHDVQFGWFRAVAARHGSAAIEVIQAQAMVADPENAQTLFRFMRDDAASLGLADTLAEAGWPAAPEAAAV